MTALTTYITFLRAVNVGGTGKLSMTDLKILCENVGFKAVRTYIASGNVLFKSEISESEAQLLLEKKLHQHMGKPVGILIRTANELSNILANNPFPDATPSRNVVIFLNSHPPIDIEEKVTGKKNEEIKLGPREIYVHYDNGIGNSKLKIPAAKEGTARNMNTIAKLVSMAETQ